MGSKRGKEKNILEGEGRPRGKQTLEAETSTRR